MLIVQEGIAGHVASDQYGRFGIIREADLASKVSEFQQWATEIKKVNVEALAKWEEKELFAEFMEDYNTGTLPHRKYYDLMAYAREKALRAAKKGKDAGVSLVALDSMLHLLAAVVAPYGKPLQPLFRPSSAAVVHNPSNCNMA